MIKRAQDKARSQALLNAVKKNNSKDVARIAPLVNVEQQTQALHWAAEHGHDDCVALLLAVSDPKHDNSGALQTAVFHQHEECIDLLFEVSDPQMALYALQDVHPDCDWSNFEQRVVHAQRDCLECVVPQKPFNKPRKI